MQTDDQIVRLAFQRAVKHVGIDSCQLIRVIAAFTNLTTLIFRAQIGPDGVIQLKITATRIVEGTNSITPCVGQIVEIISQIRIYRGINILTSPAEMQHAWARNGHFWRCVAANAFQETEILQHRMVTKAKFTGHTNTVCAGLHAVKLDAFI